MHIAKATKEDVDTACTIMTTIETVHTGWFPQNDDNDGDPDNFDPSNAAHLRKFFDLIMAAYAANPGALPRVVMGMDTIMINNVLNPDSSILELHPDLKRLDKPTPQLLSSMAYRYRHDFGLLTAEEQQSTLRVMGQLWEEVAGKGFHQDKEVSTHANQRDGISN